MAHKNKHPKVTTRRRHNWPEIIKQWRQSGIPQTEYCRRNRLDISSFSKWKKKIPGNTENKTSFIKVPRKLIMGNDLMTYPYEIFLPDNIRIRISNGFDPDSLKSLVRTLVEL